MKVVHINKKNLELEEAYLRMGKEVAAKRKKLELKRFLKLRAEATAAQKAESQPEAENVHKMTLITGSRFSPNINHSIY